MEKVLEKMYGDLKKVKSISLLQGIQKTILLGRAVRNLSLLIFFIISYLI